MHGADCPVKFWYHHPAVVPEAGTQFLQTPDGKLHYRVIAGGKPSAYGEVKEGGRIEIADHLRLSILKYLPHARLKVTFLPVHAADDDPAAGESALLVNVQAGGKDTEVWLKRADPNVWIPTDRNPGRPARHRLRLRAIAAGILDGTDWLSTRPEPGHDGRCLVCKFRPCDR